MFAQADVQYEDIRLSREQWAEVKPSSPWKVMPFLEVDGERIGGSSVIGRFLAERFGLGGEGDIERAKIAAAGDAVNDLASNVIQKIYEEKDEAKKEEIKKEILEKKLPSILGSFEEKIINNGTPEGWLYTKKVTWADFSIVLVLDWLDLTLPGALKDYPGIAKLRDSVNNLPNIKKWIAARPKTQF